jgi:hypothetical protein
MLPVACCCLAPEFPEDAAAPELLLEALPDTTSMEKLRLLTFFPWMVATAAGRVKEPVRTGINT